MSEPTPPKPVPAKLNIRLIGGIMLGVMAWGAYLAVGGYQAGVRQQTESPWLRGLVILACTVLFLGFWGGMLFIRQRRIDRQAQEHL